MLYMIHWSPQHGKTGKLKTRTVILIILNQWQYNYF